MKKQYAPILIYQMGKCASTTVYENLVKVESLVVWHIHTLDKRNIDNHITSRASIGKRPYTHFLDSSKIIDKLVVPRKKIKVISLVRDPVARNISAYFQNMDDLYAERRSFSKHDVDVLLKRFLDDYSHNIPLKWFDNELNRFLSIDVFEKPFLNGFSLFSHQNVDALVLRADLDNRIKKEVISRFLNIELPEFQNHNLALDKEYNQVYRSFLKKIELPRSYVTSMYESAFAKHFFSTEELAQYTKKWLEKDAS